MIALAIILFIVALFVLIFNVRIKLIVELGDELFLTLSVLGIKIPILPKKPKKYKLRDYTPKKIAKRDAKAAKKARLDAEKKAKKDAEKALRKKQKKQAEAKLTKAEKKARLKKKLKALPPIPDMISLFISIIRQLFSGIFKKFHFYVDRLHIKVGGEDAAQIALVYTAITNGLHPMLAFIDKHSNLHGIKDADIEISTDYLSDTISADVKITFGTSIGGILGALIKVAFKALFGWIKIAPSNTASVSAQKNGSSSAPDTTDNTSQNAKISAQRSK